ncbi:helix-turn-helix domain-containing protein [Haloarcula montana]|uniref:helix-turn-helix domain-containing protein n=1 Tax=Haloarcula montana TaxID=3111776 RepID=UPI003DA9CCB4
MDTSQRGHLTWHLSERELDHAIEEAQKTDETCLVRQLCFIKNLYQGDTRKQAGRRVGISRSTTRRWAQA